MTVDRRQWPRGRVAGFGVQNLDHQFRLEQRLQDLACEACRDRERLCDLRGGRRFVAPFERAPDDRHYSKGNELAPALVDALDLFFLKVRFPILKRVGYLRTQ